MDILTLNHGLFYFLEIFGVYKGLLKLDINVLHHSGSFSIFGVQFSLRNFSCQLIKIYNIFIASFMVKHQIKKA